MKNKFRSVVSQHAASLHPDAFGMVRLVAEMMHDRPEAFGGEEIARQLEAVLYSREGIGAPPVGNVSKFLTMVDRVGAPFGQFSAAFVGVDYMRATEGFVNVGTIITRMTGNLHFPDDHERTALTIERAARVAAEGRQVDYVLTGNVLSDPHVEQDRIFAACANLLRPGGKAIHMLSIGGHNELCVSDNAMLMKLTGSERVYYGDLMGDPKSVQKDLLIVKQVKPTAVRTNEAFDLAAKKWERYRDFTSRDDRMRAHDEAVRAHLERNLPKKPKP